MPKPLWDIIPDPEILVSLEPEEIAGAILESMNAFPEEKQHLTNYAGHAIGSTSQYDRRYWQQIGEAVSEGWSWLVREVLIVKDFNQTNSDWYMVSRRGRSLKTRQDFTNYVNASRFPKSSIHPQIVDKIWPTFIRGDWDTAVFQAFKEVEVAVRQTAGLEPTDLGVPLMRKAFDKERGPLTDTSLPEGEREALAHLFAGAIGSYKNPNSHRTVQISDANEAMEMIVLASHLIGIVEARASNPKA